MTVDTALATLQTIDLNGQWVVTDESRPSGIYPNFMPKYASECTGGQILKFQNTFDRTCDDIGMGIQTKIPRKPVMIPTPRSISGR